MNTKVDIINGAYSQLRISGITVNASPEDKVLALRRLEGMMAELQERNVCLNYNFEELPDMNSLHTVKQAYWYAIEVLLAVRLLTDFGKVAPPSLGTAYRASNSLLYSATARVNEVRPPINMPTGSGNSLYTDPYHTFYRTAENIPGDCTTHMMIQGEIDDFFESFESELHAGETIDDWVIELEGGLNIISTYRTDGVIYFRIQAIGNAKEVCRLQITLNTTDDRQLSRFVVFAINESALNLSFQSASVTYTVVHSGVTVLHVNTPVFHTLL